MFVGRRLRPHPQAVLEARKHQPAIIFIDELDAVGTTRSGGSHNREHDQTLNQLLVELDGFDEAERLIIMAASNRLEDLDPALLRPGRFDRQIHVVHARPERPRARSSRCTRATSRCTTTSTCTRIARQTSGLTGADLANICNEAAIAAGRAAREPIASSTSTPPSSGWWPGCSSGS